MCCAATARRTRWPGCSHLRRGSRLLVVVDQFEEILGLDPAAVDEFANLLTGDTLPDTVRVLITLRADFLEPVLAHPRLGPEIGGHLHALAPLDRGRLREIVTAPVDAVPGVSYEPHLAERIIADTGPGPGELPLLGLTLDLLWQRQQGGLLTHRAYEELGGVSGALGKHADRVWDVCVPPETRRPPGGCSPGSSGSRPAFPRPPGGRHGAPNWAPRSGASRNGWPEQGCW